MSCAIFLSGIPIKNIKIEIHTTMQLKTAKEKYMFITYRTCLFYFAIA